MTAPNRWRGEVLRVAQGRGGLDRMVLTSSAKHVRSEEGLRVALGAIGIDVDDQWIASVKERIVLDEQQATIAAIKAGS